MKSKSLLGTKIFAWLLILASFYKAWGLADYYYYEFMFQHLSEGLIVSRYILSIVWRLIGFVVAVFLFYGNDKARKVFMVLCVLSLALSPWQHSYKVFENIAILVENAQGISDYPQGTVVTDTGYPDFPDDLGDYQLHDVIFPRISLTIYMIIDVVFAMSVLIYFTRPKVKESFMVPKKNE